MLRRRTWWACCLRKVHRRLLRRVGQAVVVHCELVLCAAIKRRYVCKQKSQEGPRRVQTTFSRAGGGLKCSTALLSSMVNVSEAQWSTQEGSTYDSLPSPAKGVSEQAVLQRKTTRNLPTSQPTVWIRSGTSLLSLCDQASTSNWQEQRRRSKGRLQRHGYEKVDRDSAPMTVDVVTKKQSRRKLGSCAQGTISQVQLLGQHSCKLVR